MQREVAVSGIKVGLQLLNKTSTKMTVMMRSQSAIMRPIQAYEPMHQ